MRILPVNLNPHPASGIWHGGWRLPPKTVLELALGIVLIAFTDFGMAQEKPKGDPPADGVTGAVQPVDTHEADRFRIVGADGTTATIVIPLNASAAVKGSAAELVKYVKEATGKTLTVATEAPPAGAVIHVGDLAAAKAYGIDVEKLERQELLIAFPAPDRCILIGGADPVMKAYGWEHVASDIGTQYAVHEFLERFVGVRWLMAGELFLHVPEAASLTALRAEIRSRPAYLMRKLSGPGGPGFCVWNRETPPLIRYHHGMEKIYPAGKYAKTRPDFYHVLHGKRRVPTSDAMEHWNPCWSAAGLVEEGIKTIVAYFRAYPGQDSISLGIMDVTPACECDGCQKLVEKDGGFPETYAHWANAIAEGVTREFPNKQFGFLGYMAVRQPPATVKLHPALVPFLTTERMMWAKPSVKEYHHALQARWTGVAHEQGWYDYIYGGRSHVIPRGWYHVMAESLRYGRENNVRYYYAEAYSQEKWLDGPKLYVTLKLLWNPDLDVDKELDVWCTAVVGAEAGTFLRQYYDFWEDYWTRRLPKMQGYFHNGALLPSVVYGSMAYLELLTSSDLDRTQRLIDAVLEHAGPGKQRQRARYFAERHVESMRKVKAHLAINRDPLLEAMPRIRLAGDVRASISDAKQKGLDFGTDDFIVEMWCKPDRPGQQLMQKGAASQGKAGFQLVMEGWGGGVLFSYLKGTLPDRVRHRNSKFIFDRIGKWYHIVCIYRPGEVMEFVKNGAVGESIIGRGGELDAAGAIDSEEPFHLGFGSGEHHTVPSQYYKGDFGPVRIYRFAKGTVPPADELKTALRFHFDNPDKVHEQLKPHLVARWEMDGTSPGVLRDSSGNENHLELSGKIERLTAR